MKLFNTQRFQLVRGQRFKKYILYAIGEIILVVIGILIALAINDWISNKTVERQLDSIIKVIQTDLEKDLILTNALLENSKQPHKLII
jgi:hypothetical protein